MVGNLAYMKRMYASVMIENDKIQDELLKKARNQHVLMDALKDVSQMISKASDLRVGASKQHLTTACRNAIKKNNLYQLVNLIQSGRES